jgi:SAM-dependent MidA family methyltransferase
MTSAASLTTLPPLTPAERAHSDRVAAHIRDFIAVHGGAIGFDTYMRLALYAPGLGYYSAGATKFGDAGDFVTAPEVSSLFSRCLARQVAEVLEVTGGDVLELGAGLGTMAADLLTELAALQRLPQRYRILEVSADLAERQRARLARLPPEISARVEWLDRWPAEAMHGVVLANEVLDAMPVTRFVLRGAAGAQRVRAQGVAAEGEGFAWRELDPAPELEQAVRGVLDSLPRELPDGYVSEVCLSFQPWIASLAAQLEHGVA